MYENSTRHPTHRCSFGLDRLKVLKSTTKFRFRYASTYQVHEEVGPGPQNSCCELQSQAALRPDRATRDFAPEHAERKAARFAVSRFSLAAVLVASNPAETSSPLSKYTSTGVLPCRAWRKMRDLAVVCLNVDRADERPSNSGFRPEVETCNVRCLVVSSEKPISLGIRTGKESHVHGKENENTAHCDPVCGL